MLKPVTANTIIFYGKNVKFEFFESFFHTILKHQPEMTEAMKTNHFYAQLQKEALHVFRNTRVSVRTTLDDVLIVFRRKYLKPESQPTTKHKWHTDTFDANIWLLCEFMEVLNECAERAFGDIIQ